MPATTSRASSAKKKASSRRITRSGGEKSSTLSQYGETVLEFGVDHAAVPFMEGVFFAGGVIGTCNLALKAGLKVPGLS